MSNVARRRWFHRAVVMLLLIGLSTPGAALAQVVIAPGETVSFSRADSCVADTIVPNVIQALARANSTCDAVTRQLKAEVRPITGPAFVGLQTIQARAFLRNNFTVHGDAATLGNTAGAWVTYDADFAGLMLFIGFFSNPTVEVAMTLTDLTANKTIKGELIWSRDGSGFGVSIPYVPIDFNFGGGRDNHAVTNTFATVLTRGHSYRLEMRLICSVFSDGGFDVGSECDYMNSFLGGSGGGARWTRLEVKVGLDEAEVLAKLRALEQHTHTYLTGRGVGHNNTRVRTGPAIAP